jgi:hypothetical protein
MTLGNMRELQRGANVSRKSAGLVIARPGFHERSTMAEQLDEAVKLLILLSHRAAVLDDTRLNGRVDALVNSFCLQANATGSVLTFGFPKVERMLTYPRLIGRDGCDGASS